MNLISSEYVSLINPPTSPFVVSIPELNQDRHGMPHTGKPTLQEAKPRLWEPVWLRRTTLAAFMVGFTALWTGLITVWRYDINSNGFSIPAGATSSYHYAWAYGPTAVLTVVSSLWGKIDYCCKVSQPWKEMQNHLADSSKSVQLDYISPLPTTTFYRAVKNRHFAVAASVLGVVILKAVMIASAALLVSSPTEFSRTWPVNLITKFDGSGYLSTVTGQRSAEAFVKAGDSGSVLYYFLSDSEGPVYALHGLFNDSLPYPSGTQKDLAYQSMTTPKFDGNATRISAPVTAFVPNTTCEGAEVHFGSILNGWVNVTLDSPTCSVGYFSTGLQVSTCETDCGIQDPLWTESYSVLRVNCSEDKSFIQGVKIPLDNQLKDDLRFAFVAGNFSRHINGSNTGTAAVCKFDYSIQDATLEQDLLTNTMRLELSGDPGTARKLSNLTSFQLAELIHTMASGYAPISSVADGIGTQSEDVFFDIMIWTLGGRIDGANTLHKFFDLDTMVKAVTDVFDTLTIQLMHQSFLVPDTTSPPVNGTIDYFEQKIHVQPISLWLMVAGLIILSILTFTVERTRPNRCVSGDPSTIATLAAILSASKSMQDLLQGAGGLRTSELRRWLDDHVFMTQVVAGRFRIKPADKQPSSHKTTEGVRRRVYKLGRENDKDATHKSSPGSQDLNRKRWPQILLWPRSYTAALTFALPLIAIAVLEVLWQMSKTSGLRDASDVSSYAVRYSTAIIAAIIATVIDNLDFSVKKLTPYSALRSVDSSPRSLTCNLLGLIPVSALYKSCRDRNLGAGFSSLSSLIASFLTIIVSGLWVVQSVELSTGAEAWSGTTWDLAWTNSSVDDGRAGILFNRIQQNASSVPKGVWKDLVLPEILNVTLVDEKIDGRFNLSDGGASNNTKVNLMVAALRPQLDCSATPENRIKITHGDDGTIVNATHSLPTGCHGGPGGNVSFVSFSNINPDNAGNILVQQGWDNGWREALYDLHMGPYDSIFQYGEADTYKNNPNGCPSIVVLFGYVDDKDTSAHNMSVLVCSQKIQQVQTLLTLKPGRSGLLGADDFFSDPAPIESTSEYLRDEKGADTFNYRIESYVSFDLGGVDNGDLSNLLGPSHINDLIHAVNTFYNAYMVQVINKPIFRRTEASPFHIPEQQLAGNVTVVTSRLSIDYTSKTVLQIVLAAVVGLGILASYLVDIKGTLPRHPLSIASVMALMAGSRLCRYYMPVGAEWMDKPQFEKAFKGMSFSLGWWDSSADTREQSNATNLRFGIDVGKADTLGYKMNRSRNQC
ncbi:hypothetical protein F5Y12DRAFT_733669 [Xylaria sp. FL1777]|nr:hypothetical protein F5Y12DRAFT_733669 [Xylaria sp. FL1777]